MKKILVLVLCFIILFLNSCGSRVEKTPQNESLRDEPVQSLNKNSEIFVNNDVIEYDKNTEESSEGKNIVEEFILYGASADNSETFEIQSGRFGGVSSMVRLIDSSMLNYNRKDAQPTKEYNFMGKTEKLYYRYSYGIRKFSLYEIEENSSVTYDTYRDESKKRLFEFDVNTGKLVLYSDVGYKNSDYNGIKLTLNDATEKASDFLYEIYGNNFRERYKFVQGSSLDRFGFCGYVISFDQTVKGYYADDTITVSIGVDGCIVAFNAKKMGRADNIADTLEEGKIIAAENFAKQEIYKINPTVKEEYFYESRIVFDTNLKPYLYVSHFVPDRLGSSLDYYLVNLT